MLLRPPGQRVKKKEPKKVCTVCVACDGQTIPPSSEMCGRCRETLKRRAAIAAKPLKGETTCLNALERERRQRS